MPAQITRAELDAVKKAIDDAERGRATMLQLAAARDVCAGAGARGTLKILDEHMRKRLTTPDILPNVVAGLISGSIIWAVIRTVRL